MAENAATSSAAINSIDITPSQTPRRRRLAPAIAGLTGAGVVLTAGGVFAASQLSSQPGDPEHLLPGNTFMMVKVDLDPSLAQKAQYVKLRAMLATKQAKDEKAGRDPGAALSGDPASTLCEAVLEKLNCEAEVKPWLGQRMALGMWPGARVAEPNGVLVIQTKDEQAARTAVTAKYPGAVVKDGYVVLDPDPKTQSVALADEAITAHGTLADNQTYRGDVADLDGIASAWLDMRPLLEQATNELKGSQRTDSLQALRALQDRTGKVSGRVVAGLSLVDGGLQLKAQTNGMPVSKMPAGLSSANDLGQLPAGTVAGVSLGGLNDAMAQVMRQDPKGTAELNTQAKSYGLSFPRDLKRVLGESITLGVAGLDAPDSTIIARLRGADAQLIDRLVKQVSGPETGSSPVRVTAADGSVNVTSGAPGTGRLADNERFTRVMEGADSASVAAYADLTAIKRQMPDADNSLTGTMGLVGSVDRAAQRSQVVLTWNLLD